MEPISPIIVSEKLSCQVGGQKINGRFANVRSQNSQYIDADVGHSSFNPANMLAREVGEICQFFLTKTRVHPGRSQVFGERFAQRSVNRKRLCLRALSIHRMKKPEQLQTLAPLSRNGTLCELCTVSASFWAWLFFRLHHSRFA